MVTAVTYTGKVQENGTIAVPQDAQEKLGLRLGDVVQVSLNRNIPEPPVLTQNERGLAVLRKIAALQEGAGYTDGSQTDRIIRDARGGGMYSDDYVR